MEEEEEKKVKQNLMFEATGYPEERFTESGESYWYTRPDGTPITGSNWSLKDLAYPLNLLFGGKSPTDESWGLEEGSQEQLNAELSKHSFGSWLVNSAPTQLLPFLGGAKKFKQTQHNKKVMKKMKHQERVEDVTGFGDVKIYETVIEDVWNLNPTDARNIWKLKNIQNKGLIKDFTSGSLKKGGLFDPKRDDTTKLMWTSSGGGPTDKSKYEPPENFSGITPPTFEQSRQKINRAIGNDIYRRHADGIPRFDFIKLQENRVFTGEYKRLIGSDISTIDDYGLPFAPKRRNVQYESRKSAFVRYRRELLNQYEEWYGPAMRRLNIRSSDIDLDHRLTLIQSLGIYHNVDPKSQLWIDIQNTAVRRGIYPGDAERNLDLADPESHRIKSNYFNDLHGLKTDNNMKYWNGQHRNLVDKDGKPISRLQVMEESHLGPEYEKAHLEVVNDYFDVAERGNKILDSARAIWHAENMDGILPKEIVSTLMEVSIDPQYNVRSLGETVRAIMDFELDKYKKFQRIVDISEELRDYDKNTNAEIILDTDPQNIKDLKQELRNLKTVRKSPYFTKWLKRLGEEIREDITDPQQSIWIYENPTLSEMLGNLDKPLTDESFIKILEETFPSEMADD